MMKKSLKKMIICFFMMVGIMGAVAVPTEAKSHVNYTKIYKKFAKKQVKKKKKNLYMAVVKLDTPVLLITDHVWDGTVNMAHLYQYHKKKVRYIGYIGAGGTGTKLSYHKKADYHFFQAFFHHYFSFILCYNERIPSYPMECRSSKNAAEHFLRRDYLSIG